MPSPFQLRQAARTLRQGGIIAYPTEAVWGLGCDPLNANAVYRLLRIKDRPVEKGMILIAADQAQLSPYLAPLPRKWQKKLKKSWPGPNTWIIPAADNVPHWIKGNHPSIAVRVTDHPIAAAICKAFGGPIVSTSANLAGHKPAKTAIQAIQRCPGTDMIVNGELGGLNRPTTIRDIASNNILRL